MGLVKQILEFYEAVDEWCKVQPDVSNGIVLGKAAFVLNTVSDLNSHLEERIEEIKNGVIRDPFYCNFWLKRCQYLNHRGSRSLSHKAWRFSCEPASNRRHHQGAHHQLFQ